MKLLIIDDDKSIVHSLQAGLKQNYIVACAYNGRQGLIKAFSNEYDFIILDLKLPDTTGYEVCRELRREELEIPILVLTGKKLPESKVVLLDAGADDYLVKPFSLNELKARLRALLRRSCWWSEVSLMKVGDLTLNLKTRTAHQAGQPLKLSKKEFLLLHFLMRHRNLPLSRLKLAEHIWEDKLILNSNTIDVHICNLRQKLKQNNSNHPNHKDQPSIKTVHGMGYMLKINHHDP